MGKMETYACDEELVRRWMPDDLSDIDRNESWLSDLAEQGLFLREIDGKRAWFRQGTPRKLQYRIDVLSRKLTEDDLALYDSCGWHFVQEKAQMRIIAKTIRFYIFQTDENAAVPELHTDPQEQAASLRSLRRASWFDLLMLPVITLFLAAAIAYPYWRADPCELFQLLVYGGNNGSYLFPCLILPFAYLETIHRWRNVRRLYRRLALGQPLDHHAAYHKTHRAYAVIACGRWLIPGAVWLTLVIVLTVMIGMGASRTTPMPENFDFPAVRLTEIQRFSTLEQRGDDADVYLWHDWLPTQMDSFVERGTVNGEVVRLDYMCHRLPFAFELSYAMDGLIYGLEDSGNIKGYALDTDLVDGAWSGYREDSSRMQVLLVRDGRYLLDIRYQGDANLTEILPLLARRLGEKG